MCIPTRQYVAPSDAYPNDPADRSRMWIYLPEKMFAHAHLTDEQKDWMYLNDMPVADDMDDMDDMEDMDDMPVDLYTMLDYMLA